MGLLPGQQTHRLQISIDFNINLRYSNHTAYIFRIYIVYVI
jgi:hypothetical protein